MEEVDVPKKLNKVKKQAFPLQEESFLTKMDLITGFEIAGLLRIQEIVEEASASAGGYSRFVELVNNRFGDNTMTRADLLRLRDIASGEYGPKLLRKLIYVAPFTINKKTGRPYSAEQLKAIAKGEDREVNPEEENGFLDQVVAFLGKNRVVVVSKVIVKLPKEEFHEVSDTVFWRLKNENSGKESMAFAEENDLIDLVRAAIDRHGIEDFAKMTGMSPERLYAVATGEPPKNSELLYLGRGLGMSRDEVKAAASRSSFNPAPFQIDSGSDGHKHENGCNDGATNGTSRN